MRLFRIPLFLVCFFLVSGIVHAAVSDYSDVFIYNVQESSDLDSVEFDLSEIIPEENRILFKIAVVKGTERVELHEVELGGGKHVKISNLSDTYAINGYGDYTLFVKVCPAEVADYKGSGTESGCGPTKMIQIEYYPWKVESNFIEDDKVIIASIGEKFMVFATGGDIYEGKPTLKVKRLNGEESEAISCVENKFGPKVQWECTVDEGDEETTVLDFWVFDQKVSNSIVLFAQLPEMVELARFASLCEINLLEQNGSRYKYEVVHSNTRERDKLCSSPMVVVEGQGHVIASTDHTFTVEALPSEPFTIIASKGTGPSLVHSENLYDPSVLMESLSCQTLTKQTEGTLTVRRVNGDGKEVTSCYFPNVAVLQSGDRSPPEVLLKERNRIVVDATYLSSFKVVTSATGIKGLIDESFGADTRTLSEGDREYLRENFPGSIEEFE
ncbi:hypothetical protein KKG16_05725, partial [Patescibacteria group bacterium]|nr:hypothetical protein [Patescibacteria group bacterium]